MPTYRYCLAAPLSSLVTAALLFLMFNLIQGEASSPTIIADIPVGWTDVIEDTEVISETPTPEPPAPLEPPPIVPRPTPNETTGVSVSLTPPPPSGGLSFNFRESFANQDSPLVSIVRAQPVYPVRLAARGIEAYVVVAFTVTTAGTVVDARIVETTDARFSQAAIDAAERSKYRPRVVNGSPVATHNMQSAYRFTLEKN